MDSLLRANGTSRLEGSPPNRRCAEHRALLLLYEEPSGKSGAGDRAELCDFPWVRLYKGLVKVTAVFH